VNTLATARKNATPPLTQADLARLLSKRHQSQVAKLETLERELKLDDLVLWARAVGARLLLAFEEDLTPAADGSRKRKQS
jgi:transcriptional regulator with XRE-family HTH domain